MHRRRTRDYHKILKALNREAVLLGKALKPEIITTDFELAAINAFKSVYPGIKSKGCMFHLGQNIMKHLTDIALKQAYAEDDKFNQWINSIFELAFCPSVRLIVNGKNV